uniref:Uncharacterized protein n=1 Tax=Rhizophagus irregularis (strain DAOM 181602 / DAOM 197198 / MUCL 43194) TaxID=747089 RepID=U9UTL7_RHIID
MIRACRIPAKHSWMVVLSLGFYIGTQLSYIFIRPAFWPHARNILDDEFEIIKLKEKKLKLKENSEFVENKFEVNKTEIKVKKEFSEIVETEESKQEVKKKIKIEDSDIYIL